MAWRVLSRTFRKHTQPCKLTGYANTFVYTRYFLVLNTDGNLPKIPLCNLPPPILCQVYLADTEEKPPFLL